MAIEEHRIASFTDTRPAWPHPTSSASTSRSKASTNSRAHQYPLPEQLAAASFYFSPSPDAPDNCTSFIDGTNIANWMTGDDPIDRLSGVKPNHPWILIMRSAQGAEEHPSEHQNNNKSISRSTKKTAKMRGRSRGDKTMDVTVDPDSLAQFSWQDDDLLPDSKVMIAARKATFGKEWPHDSKRAWSCTSAKVAAAGFHFDPSVEEPDNAICAYCKKALAGWEKSDDPIHEHQRRRPECPFFNTRTRGSLGRKRKATEEEEKEENEVEQEMDVEIEVEQEQEQQQEEEPEEEEPEKEKESKKEPKKGKAKEKVAAKEKTAAKEKSTAKEKGKKKQKASVSTKVSAAISHAEEDEDDEEDGPDDGPSRILTNRNKSAVLQPKSGEVKELPALEPTSDEPALPKARSGKGKELPVLQPTSDDPALPRPRSVKGKEPTVLQRTSDERAVLQPRSGKGKELPQIQPASNESAVLQPRSGKGKELPQIQPASHEPPVPQPRSEKDNELPLILSTSDQPISEADLVKTVGQYLREKTNEAAQEMRAQAEVKLANFRKRVFSMREEIEATLTGKRRVVRSKADVQAVVDRLSGAGGGVGSSRDRDADADVFGPGPSSGLELGSDLAESSSSRAAGVKKGKPKAKGRPKLPVFASTPP
ncbi:unnamed protein product [Tilletia caries]|nr:unnamed protein product [Tilletia caries]